MAMTIDTIADEVFKNLQETEEGQRRVGDLDELVKRLNGAAERLPQERGRLRARPGTSFSVNTTQANSDRLTISVRVRGVDCGIVIFETPVWMFRPDRKFWTQWVSDKKTTDQTVLEWGNPGVARFIKACCREADSRGYQDRESSIQELLFSAMEGGGREKIILRGFQPVLFGGVPIQIPLPVTPRGSKKLGRHKGHSDVLARTLPHGGLVVFEVKRPAASRRECIDALEQAVKYAAALDYLMNRPEQPEYRATYWRLFGSQRGKDHPPRFTVVAFLNEAGGASESDLRAKLDQLRSGNRRGYSLSVMLYREGSNGIEVTQVLREPSMVNQDMVAAERKESLKRKRGAAAEHAVATRHVTRASQSGKRPTAATSPGREKILEVAAEGGSQSVVRTRARDGSWRFIVLRNETLLADLLDSNEQEGLAFSDESGSVDTLAAALQLMGPWWHRLTPLTLHEEYAVAIMAELLRRGGTEETARWKSELSRRSDRPAG